MRSALTCAIAAVLLLLLSSSAAASHWGIDDTLSFAVEGGSTGHAPSQSTNNGAFDTTGAGSFGEDLPDFPPVNVTYGPGDCQFVPKWSGPRCPAGFECISPRLSQVDEPDGTIHLSYRQSQCIFCATTDFCTDAQKEACKSSDIFTDSSTIQVVNETSGVGQCYTCKEGQYCPADLNASPPIASSNPFALAIVNLCEAGNYCPTTAEKHECPVGFFCPPGTKFPLACSITGTFCKEGSSSPTTLCPGGNYCPNPQTKIQCPAGSFCKKGSVVPKRCQALASCPAGSSAALIVWQGVLQILALYLAMALLYYGVIYYQRRRRNRELALIAERTQGKEVVELLRSLKSFQNLEVREGMTPHQMAVLEHQRINMQMHNEYDPDLHTPGSFAGVGGPGAPGVLTVGRTAADDDFAIIKQRQATPMAPKVDGAGAAAAAAASPNANGKEVAASAVAGANPKEEVVGIFNNSHKHLDLDAAKEDGPAYDGKELLAAAAIGGAVTGATAAHAAKSADASPHSASKGANGVTKPSHVDVLIANGTAPENALGPNGTPQPAGLTRKAIPAAVNVKTDSDLTPGEAALVAAAGAGVLAAADDDDDEEEEDEDDFEGFDPIPVPITLEFDKLGLKLKDGAEILKGVSGVFPHSRLTALMGPSGAGKSSFLNVLCGRATYGHQTGCIRLNGVETTITSVKSVMGFVPQEDVMHGDLTCYENLYYNAMLRLPRTMPHSQKKRIVSDTIKMLGLEAVQHSVVGTPESRGISGGQRKRVNIGMEIVSWPTLLFMDEPTSGLDSTASLEVLSSLRDLTELGISIITVIHQPRFSIVELFHEMLLLGRGGQTVFLGNSEQALNYFSDLGFQLPQNENPADFFLDVISGEVRRDGDPDFQPADLFELWELQGEWVREGFDEPYESADQGEEIIDPHYLIKGSARTPVAGVYPSPHSTPGTGSEPPPALNVTTPSHHHGQYPYRLPGGVVNPLSTRRNNNLFYYNPQPSSRHHRTASVGGAAPSSANNRQQGGGILRSATHHVPNSNGFASQAGTPNPEHGLVLPASGGFIHQRAQTGESTTSHSSRGMMSPDDGSVRFGHVKMYPGIATGPNQQHRRTRSLYNAVSAYRAGITRADELPLPKHRELLNRLGKDGVGRLVGDYRQSTRHPTSARHRPSTGGNMQTARSPLAVTVASPGAAGAASVVSPQPRQLHPSASTRRLNMLFERQASARHLAQRPGLLHRQNSHHFMSNPMGGPNPYTTRHSATAHSGGNGAGGAQFLSPNSNDGRQRSEPSDMQYQDQHAQLQMDGHMGQWPSAVTKKAVRSPQPQQPQQQILSPGVQQGVGLGGIEEADEFEESPDAAAHRAHQQPQGQAQRSPPGVTVMPSAREDSSPESSTLHFHDADTDEAAETLADNAGRIVNEDGADSAVKRSSSMPPSTNAFASALTLPSPAYNDIRLRYDEGSEEDQRLAAAHFRKYGSKLQIPDTNKHGHVVVVHESANSTKNAGGAEDGVEMTKMNGTATANGKTDAVTVPMPDGNAGVLPPPRDLLWIPEQFLYLLQRQCLKMLRSIGGIVFDMVLTTMVGLAIGLIFGGVWSLNAYGNICVLSVLALGVLSCVSALKMFGNDRIVFWRESSAGISITAYWWAVTLLHLPFTLVFSFLFVAPYWNLIVPDVSFLDTWWVFIGVHFACSGGGMLLSVCFAPIPALLSGVMLPLIIGGFLNGISPPLAEMTPLLRSFADISYSRYGVEALMLQEFASQPDYAEQLVSAVRSDMGFQQDHLQQAIGYLFLIGTVLRCATLLALFGVNRDKRV